MWENCHDYDPEIERELKPQPEDTTRLRPYACHFCGSLEARVVCRMDYFACQDEAHVECLECKARGPVARSAEEAIARWNATPRDGADGD